MDDERGALSAALSELLIPLPMLAPMLALDGEVTRGVDGAGEPPREEDTDFGPTLVCVVSFGVEVASLWLLNGWEADCCSPKADGEGANRPFMTSGNWWLLAGELEGNVGPLLFENGCC